MNISISIRLLINHFQDYVHQKTYKKILLNTFDQEHSGMFSELLKLRKK